MAGETTELRWFEALPKCGCGKPSNGILRGSRNESYGYHCKRCAERRLKISERLRKANERIAAAESKTDGE